VEKSTSFVFKLMTFGLVSIVSQPAILLQALVINGRLIRMIKMNGRLTLPYSYIPI
jgi:hypothetical protein